MNRIDVIYSYIDLKDKVIDVGCDQAFLSIKLAKRGQPSIASDISENVIKSAKEKIDKLNYSSIISLKVTNGLNNIDEEVDTLVLSGMGTYTIINILKDTSIKFKKIITISNNNNDILRKEMLSLNYKVKCEQIIYEKNKYYNLIVFIPGKETYTKKQLLLGINHQDKDTYNKWKDYLLNKYTIIKSKSNNKNKKINEIINLLKKC